MAPHRSEPQKSSFIPTPLHKSRIIRDSINSTPLVSNKPNCGGKMERPPRQTHACTHTRTSTHEHNHRIMTLIKLANERQCARKGVPEALHLRHGMLFTGAAWRNIRFGHLFASRWKMIKGNGWSRGGGKGLQRGWRKEVWSGDGCEGLQRGWRKELRCGCVWRWFGVEKEVWMRAEMNGVLSKDEGL